MASPGQRKRKRNTDPSDRGHEFQNKKRKSNAIPSTIVTPPAVEKVKAPEPEPESEEVYYEAEAILQEKGTGRKKKYLIKWAGDDPATGKPYNPSWEWVSCANKPLRDEWERRKKLVKNRHQEQRGNQPRTPLTLKLRGITAKNSTPSAVSSRDSEVNTPTRANSTTSGNASRSESLADSTLEDQDTTLANAAAGLPKALVEIARRDSLPREEYELLPNQTQFIVSQTGEGSQAQVTQTQDTSVSKESAARTSGEALSTNQSLPSQDPASTAEFTAIIDSTNDSEYNETNPDEHQPNTVSQPGEIVPDSQSAAGSSNFLPSTSTDSGLGSGPSETESQDGNQEPSTIEEVSAWQTPANESGQVANTTADTLSQDDGDVYTVSHSDLQEPRTETIGKSAQNTADSVQNGPINRPTSGTEVQNHTIEHSILHSESQESQTQSGSDLVQSIVVSELNNLKDKKVSTAHPHQPFDGNIGGGKQLGVATKENVPDTRDNQLEEIIVDNNPEELAIDPHLDQIAVDSRPENIEIDPRLTNVQSGEIRNAQSPILIDSDTSSEYSEKRLDRSPAKGEQNENSGVSHSGPARQVSSVAAQPSDSNDFRSVVLSESLNYAHDKGESTSQEQREDHAIGRRDFATGESNSQSTEKSPVKPGSPKLTLQTSFPPQTPPARYNGGDSERTPASAVSTSIYQSVENRSQPQTPVNSTSTLPQTTFKTQRTQSGLLESASVSIAAQDRKYFNTTVLELLDSNQNWTSPSSCNGTTSNQKAYSANKLSAPVLNFSTGSSFVRKKTRKTPPRFLSNISAKESTTFSRSMADNTQSTLQNNESSAAMGQLRKSVLDNMSNMPSPSEIPAHGPPYPTQPQSSLRNETLPIGEAENAEMQSIARSSAIDSGSLFVEDLELGQGEYIVPIILEKTQKDMHSEIIFKNQGLIQKFSKLESCSSDNPILDEAEAFLEKLRLAGFHMDLTNPEAMQQDSLPPADQYRYDDTVSAKLRFLGSLVDNVREVPVHLLITTEETRFLGMIEKYLRGKGVDPVAATLQSEAHGTEEGNTSLKCSVMPATEARSISSPIDAVIAFDIIASMEDLRSRIRSQSARTIVPIFTLVIPYSIDHIQMSMSPLMKERFDRNKLLLICIAQLRPKRDRKLRNSFPKPNEAAEKVGLALHSVLTSGDIVWTINPLLSVKDDVESESSSNSLEKSQFEVPSSAPQGTEDPSSHKRHLDRPIEIEGDEDRHKRSRTEPKDVTMSHVSDSEKQPGLNMPSEKNRADLTEEDKAQTEDMKKLSETVDALRISEASAQTQVKDYRKQLDDLQFRFEEQTSTMRKQLQVIQELEKEQTNLKRLIDMKNERIKTIKEDLDRAERGKIEARDQLANSEDPNLALLGKIKTERDEAVARLAKLQSTTESDRMTHQYTREQYQIASTNAVELVARVRELEEEVEKLKPMAQGQQARLRKIYMEKFTENLQTENTQLQQDLREAKEMIHRNLEEMRIIKERSGRQGVGTRASSVPRSPHVKPSSRAASPLPGSGSALGRVGVLRGA